MEKVVWRLASILVVVFTPLLLVATVLRGLFFDADFYLAGQARHAVGRTTEYTLDALRPVDAAIVSFFAMPERSLPASLAEAGADRGVFNEREIGHMEDVRDIVVGIVRLQWAALAIVAAVTAARVALYRGAALRWLANRALLGSILAVGIVASLGLLTLVDFGELFLAFHMLSFDNDLWQLDPRRDNLIRFFPFSFWFDATVTVGLRSVLFALVVAAAALVARRATARSTA